MPVTGRRREKVVFPPPGRVSSPREALRWERLARLVAAEYAQRGSLGLWFGGSLAGAVAGLVVSVPQGWDLTSPWEVVVAGVLLAVIVGGIAGLIMIAIGRTDLRTAYVLAPRWQNRADAYAQRRRELVALRASRR